MDSPEPSEISSPSLGQFRSVKASQLPFEQLPNLPKPVIPTIDLGIGKADVSLLLQHRPSLASKRKVGYFLEDRVAQTEDSQILDVKHAVMMLQTLTQDIGQLRRDLNFAQHVLKANYETQLQERATELYCRVNERLAELERQHKSKVDIVRNSYQTQLEDAIHLISGEYKAYYDELLQGKTGRIDLKLKDLKQQLSLKEHQLEEQTAMVQQLTERLQELEGDMKNSDEPPPPPPPPGISMEEAEELEQHIEELQSEVGELKAKLSAEEDAKDKLTRQVYSLNRHLEDEKSKYAQLQRDMESYKKKVKMEQEKAAKMAESQLAAMEKEMKQKMIAAEKEAAKKAQEQAELERIRDQARFQEELERRKGIENELRSKQPTTLVGDQELLTSLERLQRLEQHQRKEIERLQKDLEKTNRVWELKMVVMRKNFHALKDECFIRHSLQRQAAALHHATVGYAVNGDVQHTSPRIPSKDLRPLNPRLRPPKCFSPDKPRMQASENRDTYSSSPLSSGSVLLIPPPSPILTSQPRDNGVANPRNVHFEEEERTMLMNSSLGTIEA